METKSDLIGRLEDILARVDENAEKVLMALNRPGIKPLQRIIDYADGIKFGLEIARNEIKAEIDIAKQVHQ